MSAVDWIALLAGIAIVTGTIVSVVKTLVVPRRAWSLVPRVVDTSTTWGFMATARRMRSYDLVDRFLGFLGPTVLILTLLVWLGLLVIGFALMLVPSTDSFGEALGQSGSSTFTLGITSGAPGATTAVDVAASATGLIVIALTIAYLPAIYQVIRRRETLAMQLENRVGAPAWGPNVLAAHQTAVALNVLPDLYASWDRWACEVDDGHTKYPVLNQFRLPRSRHHWMVALTAMMDAAAMDLSVRQSPPPEARLFLQSGIACVNDLALTLHIPPSPGHDTEITEADFTAGYEALVNCGFPVDVPCSSAWPSFAATRGAYATAATQILSVIVAPPAPWTGHRAMIAHTSHAASSEVNVKRGSAHSA